jgi:hypothetical protein
MASERRRGVAEGDRERAARLGTFRGPDRAEFSMTRTNAVRERVGGPGAKPPVR